jgi:glycosyltransferase involved in cell wall biosynthesis
VTEIGVLELIASSRGGGAVHVRDLALGLDRGHFAPQVAMPEDGGNVCRVDFLGSGIPFDSVDIAAGFSLRALRQLRLLAAEVDILHVHGARAALFGRLAAISLGRRRPLVVYTFHGFAAPHYPAPRRQLLLAVERFLAGFTSRWICVSNAERQSLFRAGLADPHRIAVIWNGIDVTQFANVRRHRHSARLELDIPQNAFVLTTICRLYRPRDFPTLLRAFRVVQSRMPQAQLLIVGDGPLRVQVEQDIASLSLQDCVHLLGMRRDVPHILGATDLFVLSSRGWEGLPLSVLEAMAASLPVVASDAGGTREAVMDGQTGYLFAPGDAAALAQHLQSLAQDPVMAHHMGQQGRARVKQHFTRDRMVRETAALYGRLLSGTLGCRETAALRGKSNGGV